LIGGYYHISHARTALPGWQFIFLVRIFDELHYTLFLWGGIRNYLQQGANKKEKVANNYGLNCSVFSNSSIK